MNRHALGCFEDRGGGRWICMRATTVNGPVGPVAVQSGQSFNTKTVFAGYDDFTAYLASVSVESPALSRHEW